MDQELGSKKPSCFFSSGGFTWRMGAGSCPHSPRCFGMDTLQAAVETGKGALAVLFWKVSGGL